MTDPKALETVKAAIAPHSHASIVLRLLFIIYLSVFQTTIFLFYFIYASATWPPRFPVISLSMRQSIRYAAALAVIRQFFFFIPFFFFPFRILSSPQLISLSNSCNLNRACLSSRCFRAMTSKVKTKIGFRKTTLKSLGSLFQILAKSF